MPIRYLFLATLLWVCLSDFSRGQSAFIEHYYVRSEPDFAGSTISRFLKTPDKLFIQTWLSHESVQPTPTLLAIGTDGEVRWNSWKWANNPKNSLSFGEMILGNDDFLYTSFIENDIHYVAKINTQTGIIAWKTPLPAGHRVERMTETGSEEISISIYVADGNTFRIAAFDTADGIELRNHDIGFKQVTFLANDNQGFLYYGHRDTIYKVEKQNPNNLVWKQYVHVPFSVFDVQTMSRYVKCPNGSGLIILGSNTSGKGLSLHMAWDGTLSEIRQTQADEDIRDVVLSGDTLYSCWQHVYVGGGTYRFSLLSLNANTGVPHYQQLNYVNQPGTNTPLYGTAGSLSLDLDDTGRLLLTGYGNSANYGPGAWGLLQYNAHDGAKIQDKVLDITPSALDNYSMGRVVWYTGDHRLWVLGEMENGLGFSPDMIAELDPENLNMLNYHALAGDHNYGSRTLNIMPVDGGYAALQQLDQCVGVTLFDETHQEINQFVKCPAQGMKVEGMYKGKDNKVFVTASSYRVNFQFSPYYNADSLFLFELDLSSGQWTRQWQYKGDYAYNLHVTEINDTILWCVSNNYSRQVLRIVNNNFLTPLTLHTNYDPPFLAQPDHLFAVQNGRVCYKLGNTAHACYNTQAVLVSPNPTGPVHMNTIAAIPNSMDIIAGGNYTTSAFGWGWGLMRIRAGTNSAVWARYGDVERIKRIAVGPDSLLFTYGDIDNELYIKRHNLFNGSLVWNKPLQAPIGEFEVQAFDFDTLRMQIMLLGNVKQPNGDRSIWFMQMDTAGNVTAQTVRKGDLAGPNNMGLCLTHLPNGDIVMGGSVQRFGTDTTAFVWALPSEFYSVTGKSYMDYNDNAVFDTGDKVWRQTVQITPGNYLSFPDTSGQFQTSLFQSGTYQASIESPSIHFEAIAANWTSTDPATSINNADVRLRPKSLVSDLTLDVAEVTPPRFGFVNQMLVNTAQIGTIAADSAILEMDCGPAYTFQELVALPGTPTVASQIILPNGALKATLLNYQPLKFRYFQAFGQLDQFIQPGDSLLCVSKTTTFPASDIDPTNNIDSLWVVVRGSYDPNDITAFPGGDVETSALAPDGSLDLTYRIRFENTGNIATEFLRVESAFNPLLRPETFRLGATSAPCEVRFPKTGMVEFVFPSYRLEATAVDSVAAQGFIFYQLRSQQGLTAGDTLTNQAAIYFDFNPPIITNVARTLIKETVGTHEPMLNDEPNFQLWPNPAASGQTVRFSGDLPANEIWRLYSADGKALSSGRVSDGITLTRPGIYQVQAGRALRWLVVN